MGKFLFFIFTTIAIAGCTTRHPADGTLLEVERHLVDSPEVSIEMLYGIEKDNRVWETERDRAFYNLIYIETIHRLGLFTRSDSMINIAEEYFEKYGTDEDKARVCLCKGIICHDMKRYMDAIHYMKRAEEYAGETGNMNLKYRIQEHLGKINKDRNCHELAILHYRKALALTNMEDMIVCRAMTLDNIAETYRSDGITDSFRIYVKKCMPLVNRFRNHTSAEKTTKSEILTSLAQYHADRHEWDKAKDLLDEAKDLPFSTKTSKLLGEYYAAKGDMHSAEQQWKEALDPQNEESNIEAYKKLIALLTSQGRDNEAFVLSRQLNDILTSQQDFRSPAEFISFQSDYDAMVTNKKTYNNITILFLIITGLTFTVLLLVYHARRKTETKSNEYEEGIMRINIPKDHTENVLESGIVEKLHKAAAAGRHAGPQEWQELSMLMTEQAPNFMEIITHRTMLNPREIRITVLTRLRFAPSEIAILTRTSAQTVTNSRAKLLAKLFGAKGGAREFDKRIMEV